MKKLLLFATQNQHKLKELQTVLKDLPFTIIGLSQLSLPKTFQVKETGSTFCQNALLKAQAYAQKTNLLTIADDSGLIIDHLQGKPGIHSARFAQGDFSAAMNQLLQLLKSVPRSKRQASFACCLALYDPQTSFSKTFTGKVHGRIALKPQGRHGFGYDPIFFSPHLNQTFGQALPAAKNSVSHRAQALKKLTNYLQLNPYD